jgi:hypothetical protein
MMPFVKRNEDGKIVGVQLTMTEDGMEEVDTANPELGAFLHENLLDAVAKREWLESDLALVRVIEDLVDALIEKGALMFTDLPEMAQAKLRGRFGLRKEFSYMETLFAGDDDDEVGGDEAGEQYL